MKKNSIIGLFRKVLLVLIALIIGIRVYAWNAQSVLGNQLPMPFGYGAAVVLSGSMEPVLSVDDFIIIKETNDYVVGDIVVYQQGHSSVVHRIVSMDGDTVVTQGDANNAADGTIQMADVKGKVIGVLPGVGVIIRALKTPVGIITVLALAVFLVEFTYRRERENEKEELDKIREEIEALKREIK